MKRCKKRCSEEIWEGSEDYCIFHDPSKEKDIGVFMQKLKEKLDSKDYSFQGFFFPIDVEFSDKEFKKDAHFNGATFQQMADFNGATFQQMADFSDATFQQMADFNGATFQQMADFNGATFQKDTYFNGATFQNSNFHETVFQNLADFLRTTFQKDVGFNGATFQKDVGFNGATFQQMADFSDATFEQDAIFNSATFQKDAIFNGATFQQMADFSDATFEQDAIFNSATFQDASFDGVVFHNEPDFQNTQFLFRGCVTANLTQAKFHGASLENVIFTECMWPERFYEEVQMSFSFKELEAIYRNLKRNMQRNGDYSRAGKFFYREMEMKRKGTKAKEDRLWLELYRILAGYGERPINTAAVSLSVVLSFALLYILLGCLQYTMTNPCPFQQVTDALYFSFVTFTTLGLGDIRPVTSIGKALICCEAVFGAFLMALFVVVFVRKMAR